MVARQDSLNQVSGICPVLVLLQEKIRTVVVQFVGYIVLVRVKDGRDSHCVKILVIGVCNMSCFVVVCSRVCGGIIFHRVVPFIERKGLPDADDTASAGLDLPGDFSPNHARGVFGADEFK